MWKDVIILAAHLNFPNGQKLNLSQAELLSSNSWAAPHFEALTSAFSRTGCCVRQSPATGAARWAVSRRVGLLSSTGTSAQNKSASRQRCNASCSSATTCEICRARELKCFSRTTRGYARQVEVRRKIRASVLLFPQSARLHLYVLCNMCRLQNLMSVWNNSVKKNSSIIVSF